MRPRNSCSHLRPEPVSDPARRLSKDVWGSPKALPTLASSISGSPGTSAVNANLETLHDSWAAVFDWNVQGGRFGAGGELFTGRRLAAFGGAAGQNVESSGGFAEMRFNASSMVSFNAGVGLDRVPDDERSRALIGENRSAFGNVIVRITPEVSTSLEYRYLTTEPSHANERTNHHVDWALVYSF